MRLFLSLLFAGGMLCPCAQAQSNAGRTIYPVARAQSSGSIYGTAMDAAGNVIAGAQVTLKTDAMKQPQTAVTGSSGFFDFSGLDAGKYQLGIAAKGFGPWTSPVIPLAAGQFYNVPSIEMKVAAANTTVQVTVSQYELAEEQVHLQEQQRVLGFVPNFYVSYFWNAAPLTTGQKFRLALRTSVDPITFFGTGVIAGYEQWQNDFSGYGQGTAGYGKRFGAAYADGFTGTMLAGAVLPSLLHQDPRYFYKGTGSVRSRVLYALSTVVITKGDNGRWQPNYSSLLGDLGSAGISNAYYPAANRGWQLTIDNWLIGTGGGAFAALMQEFVVKKLSRGVPKGTAGKQP